MVSSLKLAPELRWSCAGVAPESRRSRARRRLNGAGAAPPRSIAVCAREALAELLRRHRIAGDEATRLVGFAAAASAFCETRRAILERAVLKYAT